MDRREAKLTLIKHIILAVVAWGVGALFFGTLAELGIFGIFPALFLAGVPFGWMWLSRIFHVYSLNSFIFKLLLSIVIGWFAIFVVLILDIIALCVAE